VSTNREKIITIIQNRGYSQSSQTKNFFLSLDGDRNRKDLINICHLPIKMKLFTQIQSEHMSKMNFLENIVFLLFSLNYFLFSCSTFAEITPRSRDIHGDNNSFSPHNVFYLRSEAEVCLRSDCLRRMTNGKQDIDNAVRLCEANFQVNTENYSIQNNTFNCNIHHGA